MGAKPTPASLFSAQVFLNHCHCEVLRFVCIWVSSNPNPLSLSFTSHAVPCLAFFSWLPFTRARLEMMLFLTLNWVSHGGLSWILTMILSALRYVVTHTIVVLHITSYSAMISFMEEWHLGAISKYVYVDIYKLNTPLTCQHKWS